MAITHKVDICFGDGDIGVNLINRLGSGTVFLCNTSKSQVGEIRQDSVYNPTLATIHFKDLGAINAMIKSLQDLRDQMDRRSDKITFHPDSIGRDQFEESNDE